MIINMIYTVGVLTENVKYEPWLFMLYGWLQPLMVNYSQLSICYNDKRMIVSSGWAGWKNI